MSLSIEYGCFENNPQKIALLTDSCADLSAEQREGAPIFVLPLKIRCEDGEFSDGVDIFSTDIYARQEAGELPKTSLPDGGSVEKTFDRIAALGYERVIALHLSSGLSGTYNMVRIQGEEREDLKVAVFDSVSGSLGMGMMLLQVWEDIKAGMGFEQLVQTRVPALIRDTHAFFSVDTLEYLMKGGRIGKMTAMAGTMLNIKPIVSFAEDGQLASVAKARGRKAVHGKFLDMLKGQDGKGRRYNLAAMHDGHPELITDLCRKVEELFPHAEHFWTGGLDATLGVYIGAGAQGVAIQFLDD